MKNILIFLEENKLKPCGGPYGYNYNLKNGLDTLESEIKIDYISNDLENKNKYSNKIINGFYKKISFFSPYKFNQINKELKKYDCIHFHTSKHLFKARKILKNYKGKVLLTSHSPMLLSKEMKEDASLISKVIFFWYYLSLIKIDKYAFKRADYLIFPCKEAEEPYEKWDGFSKAKREKSFKYIPTGIIDVRNKVRVNRSKYREMYNIPQDAFVISYVGRHNKVKGYDLLKNFAEKVLQENENVYFLVGGKEAPIKGLENDRWIEVGFTTDPYSLVNSADIFILPNLQTYFDLVLLEVISIGKPILASYTGGNKYFSKYDDIGIKLFNDINEMIEMNSEFINSSYDKLIDLGEKNRNLFEAQFDSKKFAENYIRLIKEIINE